METKWAAIGTAAIIAFVMIAGMYENYEKRQCRQAYAQTTKTVDDINKICK